MVQVPEISVGEFKERIEKIRGEMKKRDLEALIVFSQPFGSQGLQGKYGYLRYLTNWRIGEQASLIILPVTGNPTVIVPAKNKVPIAKEVSWIPDVRARRLTDYAEEAQQTLKALDISASGIGLVNTANIPLWFYQSLKKTFPVRKFKDGTNIFDRLRMVKSSAEVKLLKRAGSLCDIMFETLFDKARNGVWAYKVMAEMEYAARSEGAEYAACWMSSGASAHWVRFSPYVNWRRFKKNDLIISGVYVIYKGYWGHAMRMGVIGQSSEEQRKLFNTVIESQNTAINSMEPNTLVSDVVKSAEAVIETAGFDIYYRTLHGLGLDYSEDPLPSKPDERLKQHMVVEIHPSSWTPDGAKFAMIGDMCLITDSGPELLTQFPRMLFKE